jgi:hypothetical protein
MRIEIKNISGAIIYSGEFESVRHAIEQAVVDKANLHEADLHEADLREANLYGADLYGADLRGADLRGADLRETDLYGADLREADLRGADLRETDLREANLREANLHGTDLCRANLRGANLREADLYGADLRRTNLYGANLDSKYCYLSISPIGSENGQLWTMRDERGVLKINRGCFSGTLPEFIEAVKNKHSGNKYEKQYAAAIEFIKTVLMVDDNGDKIEVSDEK